MTDTDSKLDYEIQQKDDNLIYLVVKSKTEEVVTIDSNEKEINQIIDEILKILDENPEKKYKILANFLQENLAPSLGKVTERTKKILNHDRLEKIAIVAQNDGAIGLMNHFSKISNGNLNVRFFSDVEFADRWLKESE